LLVGHAGGVCVAEAEKVDDERVLLLLNSDEEEEVMLALMLVVDVVLAVGNLAVDGVLEEDVDFGSNFAPSIPFACTAAPSVPFM